MDVEYDDSYDQDYTSESDKEHFFTLEHLKELICNDMEAIWRDVILPYKDKQHSVLQNLSNKHFSSFVDMIVNHNHQIRDILHSN